MRLDNSADWAKWIGREQVYHERIEEGRVASLAASLDIDKPPSVGDGLPPGWQWIFFNLWLAQSQLSQDGHPRRDLPGSFLPPIPLPTRMPTS